MTLDDILTKVNTQTALIAQAVALIQAGGTDPAKLQAISDALDANTATLTAAVGTPAA